MKQKILYFISSPVPDAAQMAKADKLTNTKSFVCFRNALQVRSDDNPEKCDAVTGDVPEVYKVFRVIDADQPELDLPAAEPAPMAAVATEAPAPAKAKKR